MTESLMSPLTALNTLSWPGVVALVAILVTIIALFRLFVRLLTGA